MVTVAAHMAAQRPFVIAFRARHHSGCFVRLLTGGTPLLDGGYFGWTRVARRDLRLMERIAQAVCLFGLLMP